MGISLILLKQVMIMFVLLLLGYVLYKKNMISDQGSKDIGKILLYVVIPVVIVNNFCIERTAENVQVLFHSTIIASVCMLIAILVSYLLFKKDGVSNFSSAFSNAGFIGIPLVSATVGSHAVFYISVMIVLINVLQWTYGVFTMTNDSSVMNPKKIITNPIVIAVLIGLLIFFLQIPVPTFATDIFSIVSGLNTPLAMMVSGVYLAQSDLLAMIKNKKIYFVSIVRLVIIPVITLFVFKLLPFGSVELKLAILIAAACPVGSNVAIFAQMYQKDYTLAVEQVCFTTILCLVTLPCVISIASLIL